MHRLIVIAALALPAAAVAPPATFDARVAAASSASATREGFAYDTALAPAIHHALLPCVPRGSTPDRAGAFTLVADVDATGRVLHIDTRPRSALARCFATSLSATRLRPPPAHGSTAWPILVRMQTRP